MATALPKLSAPAQRALASQGIRNLEDLADFPRTKLAELHGLGPATLITLEEAMKKAGISYGKD